MDNEASLKTDRQQLAQAVAKHQHGYLDEAKTLYKECLQLVGVRLEAYFFLGVLHCQEQDWKTACEYLEEAHRIEPQHLDVLNALGNARKHRQQFDLANRHFEQALMINPNHKASLQNYGTLLLHQGLDNKAQQQFKHLLSLDPLHHDARYNLALQAAKHKDFAKVVTLLKPLKQDLTYNSALLLGQALIQQNCYKAALSPLKYALGHHPNLQEEIHFQLAIAYDQLGASSKAHWHYEQCIALCPEHLEAHSNLADSYVKTKHYQRAVPHYSFLLQHQPKDLNARYHMGLIYMQLDQHQEALDYFQAACELDSRHLPTLLNIASTYLALNAHDKAIKAYQDVLALYPEHQEASFILEALQQTSTPVKMPSSFISSLFDHYAPHYEKHLTDTLHYQVPQQLLALLCSSYHPKTKSLSILDIGCGSGLMADTLFDYGQTIDGIDLSESMIQCCKQKGLYQNLWVNDFCTVDSLGCYDLLVAADVLPYIGNLETLLQQVNLHLHPGAYFLFSAEKSFEAAHFSLQKTIRYAHHPDYIRHSLQQAGFTLVSDENAILRQQKGQDLHGHLYLAQKTTAIA